MPVFEVYLNGKKVATAGVGEMGVLGAHVSWVHRIHEKRSAKKMANWKNYNSMLAA